ncbi:MAG TPA: ATP-binding protein [Kofleriaceae bacterium]|jgi:signal transduction histidine kinase
MRTLSARILLGFAALTVAFAVITGTVVFNMRRVEDQAVMIGKGFVPLALAVKDLARRQDDLRNYLEESLPDESSPMSAKVALTRARGNRDRELKAARRILDSVTENLTPLDPSWARQQIQPRVEALEAGRDAVNAMYDQLLTAPPIGEKANWTPAQQKAAEVLNDLKNEERKTMIKANSLSDLLDQGVTSRYTNLERNQRTVRTWTVYLGISVVVFGIAIIVSVVITLRPLRRLREGARRIAAGDYASRIPERGPAEVSDLAREFNSMGRAVEERERELVRSERLVAVGKMAAMITHEVRNPLSSIGLNTELLEDELENSTEARELCRSIHREVDRLTAITEDYLAFARLPKPKIAPEPLNPFVTSLAQFVKEDLATRKVALETELCAEHVIAKVDGGQLRQCLINLVRNAADAVVAAQAAGNTSAGTVTVRTRRDGDRVAIEVADDGIGIPADALPHVFDPFFSTKEGGNGLGLALTHEIVREHGGDLDVQSTVGRGTTFTLRLPVASATVT